MTIQNPPIFIQAGSHPAEDVRRWMDAMVESTAGVVAAGDLAVTQNGTPNMSVEVASGRGFVAGDEATYQGTYAFENRGTTNVVVSASDPTNPRIDLIVVRVRDAAYSGATNTVAIEAVTGTPAATPAAPATPDNCMLLARVAVAALATTVVNANITDLRTRAYALGVSALNAVTTPTAWTNVTYTSPWADYGGGFQPLQYRKIGDMVTVRGMFRITSGTVPPVVLSTITNLPVGFRPSTEQMVIALVFSSTGAASTVAHFRIGTGGVCSYFADGSSPTLGTSGWVAVNITFSVTA